MIIASEHPGLAQLRAFMQEKLGQRHTIPLEQRRAGLDALSRTLNPPPADIEAIAGELGGVPHITFRAPGADGRNHVLYLHGGAFVAGSPASHAALTAGLARLTGASVHSLDYALAPEAPFPAAPSDCLAAYRALVDGGISANRIAIAGDSAGGSLALGLLVAVRDAGLPLPAAAALLSPALDLTQASETYERLAPRDPFMSRAGFRADIATYLRDRDPADPAASPVFADLRGLPPLLVQIGTDEVLLGDSLMLVERVAAAHCSATLQLWPAMVHVWHLFPNWLSEADEALRAIAQFFAARWR